MKKNKKIEHNTTGIIAITSKGMGYLTAEGFEEDIQIEQQFLNTALHGDKVEVTLFPKVPKERLTGEVSEIIERAKDRFVGTIDKKKGNSIAFVIPDDRKMYVDIYLPANESSKVQNGWKVLVEIKKWDDPKKNPEGRVIKTIGKQGDHNTEMEAIVLEKGFQMAFPGMVEKEAKQLKRTGKPIPKEEIKKRRDMRDINTFTIDPYDAKDLDDAISFKKIKDGLYEIGIHIADVSHYVKEGSKIDEEARKRGTSIYLVDRTIPMLPEVLSNDLCSLHTGEDKLTFSAVLTISPNGEIKDRWFGRTIINSNKRFSYEEAQEVLNKKASKENSQKDDKYYQPLNELNKLAEKFRAERMKAGAIDFDSDEVKFKLDSKGTPIEIIKKERLPTHELIEEFMIMANKEVATYLSKDIKKIKKGASLYRTHGTPKQKSIEELLFLLKSLGYEAEVKGEHISSKELNKILSDVENEPEESLVKTIAIRSMSKAIYSIENTGHYGLALENYTHFTSPIRRYADLLLHRILDKHLNGKALNKKEIAMYHDITIELSEREINAAEAERDSVAYKQVEYMLKRIGKTYTGVISGITSWGVYVEEETTKASGMVKFKDMKDDFYTFDKETFSLIGSKNKKKYSVGDEVKIKITGGDLIKKTLDYTFA